MTTIASIGDAKAVVLRHLPRFASSSRPVLPPTLTDAERAVIVAGAELLERSRVLGAQLAAQRDPATAFDAWLAAGRAMRRADQARRAALEVVQDE